MSIPLRVLPLLSVLTACDAAMAPAPGGDVVAHRFPELDIEPGGELNYVCQSWTLDNDEPLYVSSISIGNGPGWHHSNWLVAPETDFAGPDGTWDCDDRGFELVAAGVSGGILFTQSPESVGEVQRFGPGAAVVIPPRSKIIGEIHLINFTPEPLSTSAELKLGTLSAEEATVHLSPLALTYYPLALPPESQSEFTASCDLTATLGGPLDFRIHFVTPHYHELGEGMRIEAFRADGSADLIYETDQRIGRESLGSVLPEPYDLTGAAGVRFTCRYDNPLAETVGFGSGAEDEMCVMFAFTDAKERMVGGVLEGSKNTPLAGGAVPRYTSACQVFKLPD